MTDALFRRSSRYICRRTEQKLLKPTCPQILLLRFERVLVGSACGHPCTARIRRPTGGSEGSPRSAAARMQRPPPHAGCRSPWPRRHCDHAGLPTVMPLAVAAVSSDVFCAAVESGICAVSGIRSSTARSSMTRPRTAGFGVERLAAFRQRVQTRHVVAVFRIEHIARLTDLRSAKRPRTHARNELAIVDGRLILVRVHLERRERHRLGRIIQLCGWSTPATSFDSVSA